MIKRIALRSSVFTSIVSAMMIASPVLAQDAATPEEPEAAPEVIIVTATGRQSRIQDIPIAVTAVTAQTIQNAGITDVRTLQQVAPSYRVATGQSNSAGTSIAIRGIGTGADNPGFEAAVAVFIDGVYRNRSGVALSELPQVERVEVLRGPQGTLFGRNTSAGAVSVLTAPPKFEASTYGKIEFGQYDGTSATLGVNAPLSDTVAVRVEGNYSTRGGLIENVNAPGAEVNDRNRYFIRGQALIDLGETANLRIIIDTSATDEVCCSALHSRLDPAAGRAAAVNATAGFRGLVGIPAVDLEARRGAFSPNRNYGEVVDESGISAELNWDVGPGRLTSVTSSRDWSTTRNQDIDFSGQDRAYRDGFELGFNTFTQELRYNGQTGSVNWLVGAFYAAEDTDYRDTVRFGEDAARYPDVLAAGVDLNGPAPGGTGFTVYGSLPGQTAATPSIFTAALLPGLTASLSALPPAGAGPLAGPVLAGQIATAFGNAVRATAPVPGQGQQNELTQVEARSVSLFTHNIIDVTDAFTVTLGARFNTETKDMVANLNATAPGCGVLQNTNQIVTGIPISLNSLALQLQGTALGGFLLFACNPVVNTVANGTYTDSREETEWTGVGSLQYEFNADAMVYATLSHGYKGGGFNLDRSAFRITPATTVRPSTKDWQFEPEFVDNYEIGWKLSSLPGRTTINGALFYQDITDYQLNAFTGFNFVNFNAPTVISKGLELDMVSRPMSGLTLTGGMLYNDATFDTDIFLTDGVTGQRYKAVASGTTIAGASEWTFTASATYRQPIPGTSLGFLGYLDARWQSEYQTQTLGRDVSGSTDQDAFSVINGRIGIGAQDGSWSLELWGRNLADTFYRVGAFGVPEQTATITDAAGAPVLDAQGLRQTIGNFAVYPGEPRMMGISLRASF